jgi:hypothetical protein
MLEAPTTKRESNWNPMVGAVVELLTHKNAIEELGDARKVNDEFACTPIQYCVPAVKVYEKPVSSLNPVVEKVSVAEEYSGFPVGLPSLADA